MLTSFAPSPIERVTFEGNRFLIKLTISAFYFGDTLQASTTSALIAISRNYSLMEESFSKMDSDAPEIMIAYLTESFSILSFT